MPRTKTDSTRIFIGWESYGSQMPSKVNESGLPSRSLLRVSSRGSIPCPHSSLCPSLQKRVPKVAGQTCNDCDFESPPFRSAEPRHNIGILDRNGRRFSQI